MSQDQQSFQYFVTKVAPCGDFGVFNMLETGEEWLSATAVITSADPEDKISAPKLTYSLSVNIPENGQDVAIIGESSLRAMQIPKQIWIFNENAGDLVTHEDVKAVIRILKQDYPREPLALYFE